MNVENDLADIDVVVLCKGLGTRLRSVSPDQPKSLMPFDGKPFIEILMESLLPFGFKRFVLRVGYLEANGIETRTLFSSMLTQCAGFRHLGRALGYFPNAEYWRAGHSYRRVSRS